MKEKPFEFKIDMTTANIAIEDTQVRLRALEADMDRVLAKAKELQTIGIPFPPPTRPPEK